MRFLLLASAVLLVACGGPADPPASPTNGAAAPPPGEPDNRIECRPAGAAALPARSIRASTGVPAAIAASSAARISAAVRMTRPVIARAAGSGRRRSPPRCRPDRAG